jgi:predicted MPP superfamily phosphohydrolase
LTVRRALSLQVRQPVLLALALAALLALYGFLIEPRFFLLRDRQSLGLGGGRLRIAHLSDLHVRGASPLLRRLQRAVAASRPDLIVISGDLIHDVPPGPEAERVAAATSALLAALRRSAPVYLVQGHSEHDGSLIPRFARAGAEWLSNEGRLVGPQRDLLLLGLNQQLGLDLGGWGFPSPFRSLEVAGGVFYGARRGQPYRNFYSHYDPHPAGLADAGGPLAWSGYDTTCEVRIDGRDAGVGIAAHSRYVIGEDRMIELHRDGSRWSGKGDFALVLHGSGFTAGGGGTGGSSGRSGHLGTGVVPQPDRWYRLRLRTEVEPGIVRVLAKAWPAARAEPSRWQAWGEDRSPFRVTAGTVGLWAAGGGGVAYRNLKVIGRNGEVLLDDPLAPRTTPSGAGALRSVAPAGFHEGLRATRLGLALARSPAVPPGTRRIVLSHVPDVALEASRRGIDAVLAGHTHGGQIRLPFLGPLTTRSALGPYFGRGLFHFGAPNRRGMTVLYVNSGIGMSVLPVRFGCPPSWALIEVR